MNTSHHEKPSQARLILHHLEQGLPITSKEALKKFGCARLGARIYELKKDGHCIERKIIKVRQAYVAEYRLTQDS